MSAAARIARDYVVSTTYRKYEQDGLKWSEWRAGQAGGAEPSLTSRSVRPHDTYRRQEVQSSLLRPVRFLAAVPGPSSEKLGSIAEIASGILPAAGMAAQTVLATILAHVASPLRWEPLNGASPHRGIPSGGGIFGAELFVVAWDGEGPALFRQIPQDNALCHEGVRPGLGGLLAGADLAFVIVGNLASFVDPYGEFSPCLASLECGILQAQLSLLCGAHGWALEIETRHDYGPVSKALGLDHWSRIPAAIVRVTGAGAADSIRPMRREMVSTSERIRPDREADDFPRMRALIEAIATETVPESRPPAVPASHWAADEEAGSSTDLLEIIRRRTSGHVDDLPQAAGRVAMADLTALAADLARLHSIEGRTDLADVGLSLGLLATDSVAGIECPFAVDLRGGHLSPATSPSSHWNRLVFTIGVDDVAEERRSGARSFLLNHLAAGALGQRLCLAAAARGLFARPLRSYSEAAANKYLGLESRAILQVACGVGRRVNPSYDLSWW
jgi:hypothetical protein